MEHCVEHYLLMERYHEIIEKLETITLDISFLKEETVKRSAYLQGIKFSVRILIAVVGASAGLLGYKEVYSAINSLLK